MLLFQPTVVIHKFYGIPLVLMLCVAAGWMRFIFWACMALFAVGKLFRYLLVAGGWTWFLSTIWPWMKVTFGW